VRRYVSAFVLVITSLINGAVCMCSVLISRRKIPTAIMRLWAKTYLWSAGIKIDTTGMHHVDAKRPCIYMSNHASILDIMLLISLLPVDLRFVYKQSLTYIPFVGWAIWLMGMIPIDRSNRNRAIESLKKAGRNIRHGYHLMMFPEGTRTRSGELLPFKRGGFALAMQNELEIVPISLLNSRALCGRNSILARAGTIRAVIHPRVAVSSDEDRSELIEKVRGMISSALPTGS